MKRKLFSVLFALVLVLSFSLVTAVPVGAQESISITGAVDATITRTDTLDEVTFDIEILSEDPAHGTYGVGVAFATSLDQPAFQVWYREYEEPVGWYYQDYGTGWDGEVTPLADKTGFSATGDLTGQTFSLSVPTTQLGGFGAIYYYAIQVRTNLLNSYPEGWGWGSPVSAYASVKLLVLNEDTGKLYATIQAAINDANPAGGDTILVAAGTYTEAVTVNKSLMLEGEDRDTTEIKFGYDSYPSASPLTISADGVTVSGFTIRSGPYIEPAWTIVVEGNSTLLSDLHVIKDPLLWGNNTPRIGGAAILLGTPVDGLGVGGVDSFTFTDSIVDSARNGIYAPRNPGSSNIVVRNVDFTYPSEYAILLMMVTGAIIEGNTFTCTADQYGVTVTRGSSGIGIADNQFIGSGSLAGSHTGILLQAYAEGTMGDVTILSNGISGFNTGILVEDVVTSGISIHYNNITGNAAYGVNYLGSDKVNATNNWWGDATGPAHASNPHGGSAAGDGVTDNVDFTPWYATATTTPGTQNVSVEHSSIIAYSDTIQGGIDAAVSGDTVNVAAGTYDSSLETFPIAITKSLTLLGAQVNVDPRPSQGGRTGNESIIDADETSAAVIRISASHIEINGFTITGGMGDMVEENTSADNLLFCHNILYDDLATTGDEAIQIKYSDGVVIEYNYAYNILQDAFNLSDSTNGAIRYNEAHDIHSENAAIYCYGATNIDIIGNLVYDVPNNDGIKLGDSDDGSTGGIVKDNEVHDAAEDGITIYASGVTVENNTIYNCDSENGALYLYGADNSTVTKNRIYNNDAIGLLIHNSSNVTVTENKIYSNDDTNDTKYSGSAGIWLTSSASSIVIHYNSITGNADFGIKNEAAIAVAAMNWWGDAGGPDVDLDNDGVFGDAVSGNVDADPWVTGEVEVGAVDSEDVTGSDVGDIDLEDDEGHTIAKVDISGAPGDASGTITAFRYSEEPEPDGTSLSVGTGKTGVVFLDVRVTGYTSGMAHIIVPYPDVDPADGIVDDTGIVETTLGLYYWDEAASMWRIAANSEVDPDENNVSGDIPVSALGGTSIGTGGYPADEATVAIGDISVGYSGNDIVALTITTGSAQLGAVTIDLTFDSTVVKVLGGENSEFDSLIVNPSYGSQTTARFVANQLGPAGVDAGEVVVAQVRLMAVGTTGSSSSLTLNVVTLKDNDGISIPYVTPPTHGTATIGGLGDANSDGAVDAYDCVYTARAIAGIPAYSLNEATMDVSGDGELDAFDCTYLARHIAGIVGYERLGG